MDSNEQAERLRAEADGLYAAGRLDEALARYREAAATNPDSAAMPYNIANVLRLLGRTEEALAAYDASLARLPRFAVARHNRAVALLQLGRWQEGFREYEWRKACPEFVEDPRYRLPRPWQGESVEGKTLYIFPELYQGDLIQFGRYALLAERIGARVLLGAPPEMHALLRTMSPTLTLVDAAAPPPDYDFQAPLLSLPLLFGTTPDSVPRGQYLQAEPARVARWREHLGSDGLKIGIVWQGSAKAAHRSFPLALAAEALGAVPGVRLISLQKHAGLDQLAGCPKVETLGEDFDAGPDAFLDTAAAIRCCDLFVSADTSTAHLAGALAAPAWLALNTPADWRWLESGAATPWYPTLRLFRQHEPGGWAGVFAEMREVLVSARNAAAAKKRGRV